MRRTNFIPSTKSLNALKSVFLCLLFWSSTQQLVAQERAEYSDKFLTSSFKVFKDADFEMAYHILPFLRKRFNTEIQDSATFFYPYDSLSNYIDIKHSSDSLLRIFCWSERNGSCCYTSATYAQYRTVNGGVKVQDLEVEEDEGEDVFITDLYTIEIDSKVCYLLLGWGTCCGGKQHEKARVYEIKNGGLVKSKTVFEGRNEIYVGANRTQETGMNYSVKSKTLTYIQYEVDKETSFFTNEKTVVKWKLTKSGFKRIN
jgi:hypothetical protein